MNQRRARVLCGIGALCAGAGVGAQDNRVRTELELQGHVGTASGRAPALGCGTPPLVGLRYGGGGARVRWRPRVTGLDRSRGPELVVAGAVEHHVHHLREPGSGGAREIPPDGIFAGVSVSGGFNWRGFGLRGGLTAYERIPGAYASGRCASTDPSAMCFSPAVYRPKEIAIWPEVHLRFGKLAALHGELGWGAYNVSTVLRPGFYGGLVLVLPLDWQVALHAGVHRAPQFDFTSRFDLALHIPVHRHLRIEVGAAVTGAGNVVSPEARAAAEIRF